MSDESIAVLRAKDATDAYGDPVPGKFTTHITVVGKVAPNNPAEPVEVGRNAVITGGTVYLRVDAVPDILPTDRVTIRDNTFEVDGEIGVWKRSANFGVQFAFKQIAG